MGARIEGPFPGVKQTGLGADYSPPFNADVNTLFLDFPSVPTRHITGLP